MCYIASLKGGIKIKTKFDKAKAFRFITKLIPNIILCLGIFLISFGVGQVYSPAGFITLGLLIIIAILAIDFK